jgi:hypothetical protein
MAETARKSTIENQKSHLVLCFIVCLLTFSTGFGAQPSARKPLGEGIFLQGIDGRLIHDDANDVWLFELTADVNMPGIQVPAQTPLALLASTALENMIADANDHLLPNYRLAALVTRYGSRNFLFPIYYLPLSKWKEPNEPVQESPEKPTAVVAAEPNGAPPIPSEIAEMLKNRPVLRGPQRLTTTGPSQMAPTRMLADVVGFLQQRQDRAVFVPDALGLSVSGVEYELLPCATLEEAQRLEAASPERVRFSVAGLLSEYKGKKYLLLQRAIRAYSFGDFGG